MSPIEYIAEGIRQGNWETVCEGYERLTGEALPIPISTTSSQAEDMLQQVADIISSVSAEPIPATKKPAKKKPGRPKGSGKKKTIQKTTATKNGEDSSLQLDDNNRTMVQKEAGGVRLITNDPDPEEVKRNKAMSEKVGQNKVSLDRKTTGKYSVKCNECEEMFESDRKGSEMGQKCPDCLRGKKSRFS